MANRVMLTVIRHLPTIGNQQRQYIGWTDEPIIPVEKVHHPRLGNPTIVHCSDLQRCQQSARRYFPHATLRPDRRWRELHFGEWEGKTYAQLKSIEEYRQWIDDPFTRKPPNGESVHDVKKRLFKAIQDLPTEDVHHVVVTHGGPMRILFTACAPTQTDFWSWNIPHGSVWQCQWNSDKAMKEGARCTSLSAVPITERPTM